MPRKRAESRAVDENAVASSRAGPAVGIEVGAYKLAAAVVVTAAATVAVATAMGNATSAAVVSVVAVSGARTPISMAMAVAGSTNAPPLDCDGYSEFVILSLDRDVDDSDKPRHRGTISEEAF